MNVLVLGGTGAIGASVVDILEKQKHNVYVTSRKEYSNRNTVTFIHGDAMNVYFLQEVLKLQDWDCIIDFMSYKTVQFANRIQLFLASTKQYMFLSSARVYDFNNSCINEESSRLLESCDDKLFLASDDYALEKARQEDILRKQKMRNWTIIRPYKTYSDSRLQLGFLEKENWLYRCMKGRTIVFSNDLAEKYTILSNSDDVATVIALLVANKNAISNIYQVVTGKQMQWKDILSIYINCLEGILGHRPQVLYKESAYKMWKGTPDYTIQYDSLKNHFFSSEKIKKEIFEMEQFEFITEQEGIESCLRKFMENPRFKNISWVQEAWFDKLTHEKTHLKEIQGFKNKIVYLIFRYTFAHSIFVFLRKVKYRRL